MKIGTSFSLDEVVNKLLDEKGLANLDEGSREQAFKDVFERLEDRINLAIIRYMPKDKLDDFEKLLIDGKDTEILTFCQEQIPGLNEIIAAEIMTFRQTYLYA